MVVTLKIGRRSHLAQIQVGQDYTVSHFQGAALNPQHGDSWV